MKFVIIGKEKLEGTEMILKKVPKVKGSYSPRIFFNKSWENAEIAIIRLKTTKKKGNNNG